jgi:nicotinamidase-related amidase
MQNDFLTWLDDWMTKLPDKHISDLGNPENIAVISVDMVNGFCHKGSLASKEVNSIIPPVVDVLKKAHDYGIKHFLLLQDAHSENAAEFDAYPNHCVKGSEESQTIPEIANLPFSNDLTIFEKNAWSPAYDTKFDEWTTAHPEVHTFIIIGDCTDICVYSIAMHLRMQSFAKDMKRKVIIPANAVATYDMPVSTATKLNAMPHDAELLHKVFLYHMALSAIEIVQEVA